MAGTGSARGASVQQRQFSGRGIDGKSADRAGALSFKRIGFAHGEKETALRIDGEEGGVLDFRRQADHHSRIPLRSRVVLGPEKIDALAPALARVSSNVSPRVVAGGISGMG